MTGYVGGGAYAAILGYRCVVASANPPEIVARMREQ
jgi:hypothetical protein